MAAAAFEGIVENGLVRLDGAIRLPENARVYVLVPDVATERVAQDARRPMARVVTPRLKHPEQAVDFEMEVVEEAFDARV